MRRSTVVLGILAALMLGACSKETSNSLVVVTVTAPGTIPSVTQLRVTLKNAGSLDTKSFPAGDNLGTPIAFDTSFVLSFPKSRSGNLDVTVDALDAASNHVASGFKSVMLVVGGRADVTISLALVELGDGGVPDTGVPEVTSPPREVGGDVSDAAPDLARDSAPDLARDSSDAGAPDTPGDSGADVAADGGADAADSGQDADSGRDTSPKLDGRDVAVANVCGNGKLESGEACDCGNDPNNLPSSCKAVNGLFYGDGRGCSKTCSKEPICLSAGGQTQACAAVCGDGNVDPSEGCDDGNLLDGDGCSSTCTVESGFSCAPQTYPVGSPCQSGSGTCLQLPVIYRDFQPENVTSGGHPDFPFLGTKYNGSTSSTTICVPNAAGPSKGNDSTSRCWGIAGPNLLNGKPQPGPTTTCACQFSDWNIGNSSRIPGGYTQAGNDSPLSDGNGGFLGVTAGTPVSTTSTGGAYTGTLISYTASTPGGPMWKGTVPAYKSATSFKQWFNDDPSVNKTFTSVLEMQSIGSNVFQYASKTHLAQGGFFPLDTLNPSQTTLCNLWPYWNHGNGSPIWASCVGDQYLFPPRVVQSDCPNQNPLSNGCWVNQIAGVKHDSYFTDEARYYFAYDGATGVTLGFYGDDDLFVFINGVLVVDLGGTHTQLPGQVRVTGSPGDAQVMEGGCLDAAGNITGATAGSTACSPTSGSAVAAMTPDDFRVRTVSLGLVTGKVYEIAIFGADRHPPDSNFQITLSGLTSKRSICTPSP